VSTKQDLIDRLAEKERITKVEASRRVNSFLQAMQDELVATGSLQIVGFSTFKVVERAERKGRNPQTGEDITIPAKKTVTFKPGVNLIEAIA
jgi:DNA-binding protein HU-beta